jgi:hypothetical protein
LARRILAEFGMDPPAGAFADVRQRVRDNLDALAGMGLARVVAWGGVGGRQRAP